MKSTEILEREHGWIEWMACCLEALIAQARSTGRLAEETTALLYLYESFADGRHQEKEEGCLFPELLAAADARARAVLEQLVRDHGTERHHMERMRRSLGEAVAGSAQAVRAFGRAAADYMELHRAHVHRENEVLLPLIERLLTPEADARVVAGFEALEGAPGDPHGLEEQIRGLCRSLEVPMPPAA